MPLRRGAICDETVIRQARNPDKHRGLATAASPSCAAAHQRRVPVRAAGHVARTGRRADVATQIAFMEDLKASASAALNERHRVRGSTRRTAPIHGPFRPLHRSNGGGLRRSAHPDVVTQAHRGEGPVRQHWFITSSLQHARTRREPPSDLGIGAAVTRAVGAKNPTKVQ
jgi:hypothetical protein